MERKHIGYVHQDLADQLGGFVSTLLSTSDEAGASSHGGKISQSGKSMYVPWMLPEKMLAALEDSLLHEVQPSSEVASLPPAGTHHATVLDREEYCK